MSLPAPHAVLRVGKIDFLNTLPFFHGWEEEAGRLNIRFVSGSPSWINEELKKGAIDLGLASSLAYAGLPDDYLILPGLCIGAHDRSGSVTLYSSEPLESLNGKRIALSSKSLSASSLLKILLKLRLGFENEFEESSLSGEEMLRRYPSCLLIGDEALFLKPEKKFRYDLSRMWWEWTGFPFCFALWTVRRSSFEKHPAEVETFYEVLSRLWHQNIENLDPLVDTLPLKPLEKRIVADYLGGLEYVLTSQVEQGLRLFFQYACRLGLIRRTVPLNFCGLELVHAGR